MYQTLLVPLDGSKFSERALPIATALAQSLKARVALVTCLSTSALRSAGTPDAEFQATGEAQAYLAKLAQTLSEQGLRVETDVVYGEAAEAILREVDAFSADLVVMCTHGRSGLGRWIFGSVAERVLAHSPVPVLLVRPTGEPAALEPEPAQASILVPLDGSPLSEQALPHATALARALNSPILLLHSVEPSPLYYNYPLGVMAQETLDYEQGEARAYLDRVAKQLEREGVACQTQVLVGWPSDVIAYRGAAPNPRLIVMATHGRSGIARLLMGSVALEVVRRSPLPILLVRPEVNAAKKTDRAG